MLECRAIAAVEIVAAVDSKRSNDLLRRRLCHLQTGEKFKRAPYMRGYSFFDKKVSFRDLLGRLFEFLDLRS